ncbi:outer membrane protein assembly factor BamA [Candidatus Pelagibacter sp. HIMB1748]|uniref:outer membrane protein assembly factor BamA n=1 Tax=unclassified Candidatus Pelagibacter TaxID=2647897 RepID=UPI003F833EE8
MISRISRYLFLCLIILSLNIKNVYANNFESIEISGNDRISNDTILMFANIEEQKKIDQNYLNEILKNVYESNFFNNVEVEFSNNIISIKVEEFPIIENIYYEGIKANKTKDVVYKDLQLKSRSSYNEIILKNDKIKVQNSLKNLGYYFSNVDILLTELNDNKVNLTYKVDLGKKAKIKKISFIGNKVFKDRKLKRVIASEEYKYWKFISGKKYLNENLIAFDEKLLLNYYRNQGYYDVAINTSFAKLVGTDGFELLFNINANKKFYFNDISINLPFDFDDENFVDLKKYFNELKGKKYSINLVEEMLEKIDNITLEEQFESIKANVNESIVENKINIEFNIEKTEQFFVERINIFGNNVTRENVIRNQLIIDEGDPYNQILANKSLNNIKSLRFFKSVNSEVLDGSKENSKIINISVEEQATGEVSAGAGFGTDGASILFAVRENNYLGRGISLDSNIFLKEDSVKGKFQVTNPNFNDSDKSIYFSAETSETDKLKSFGYKTNKYGFSVGTYFEYLDDLNLGIGTSNFYEKIDTNTTASARQKKQQGDYWDTFLNLNFDLDKRNQKFQTNDGYRNRYFLDLPILSEKNTLGNTYNYQYFTELYDANITSFSFYIKTVESLSNDDVKLSERIFLPSSRLRGFENGKVGPKDGKDFIGGNYATAFNFSSSIPQILENSQTIDFLFFLDAANVWGVDYDSSIDDNSKIRSSVGIGIDWLTPVGPMNFTFAETISKADTDIAESFRFNLGTTF